MGIAVPRGSLLLSISLVALLVSALQPALAAPSVDGAIEGRGTASSFSIRGGGAALEGGTHDWSIVCGGCDVRLTLVLPSVVVLQNGRMESLSPGTYEIRDFRGLVQVWEYGLGDFELQVHGVGTVTRL